jgi:hypothetical protein
MPVTKFFNLKINVMKKTLKIVIPLILFGIMHTKSNAQFTPNNLVVIKVGNGSNAINNTANAVTLVQYTTSGVAGFTVPLNYTTAGNRLLSIGSGTQEGSLRLSTNGKYLSLVGYDADLNTATATTSAKVIARVGVDGTVDYTTKIGTGAAFNGGNVRAAVSVDGTNFWVNGSGTPTGVYYVPFGNPVNAAVTQVTAIGPRSLNIYNNQLYYSGAAANIGSIGTGLPTASSTNAILPGIGNNSPFGFVMFDMDATEPGLDVAYVADQTSGGAAGLRKFSKVSGTWVTNGTLNVTGFAPAPATNPGYLLELTGKINTSGQAVLYATRGTGENNSLVSITDPNGYNVSLTAIAPTFTHLASAGVFYTFKGVAFTPKTPKIVVGIGMTTERVPAISGIWRQWNSGTPEPNNFKQFCKRDIGSNFYPKVGVYDMADTAYLDYHFQLIKIMGIDAVSVYNPEPTDLAWRKPTLEKYFTYANRYGIKVYPRYGGNDTAMMSTIMSFFNPAMFKINDRPIFSFFSTTIADDKLAAWKNSYPSGSTPFVIKWLRQSITPVFDGAHHWIDNESRDYLVFSPWKWYYNKTQAKNAYDTAIKIAQSLLQQNQFSYYAEGISPGFNDSAVDGWSTSNPVRHYIERDNGNTYMYKWQGAIAHQYPMVVIPTLDDWGEGSMILPTVEFGNKYVDLTRANAALYKGTVANTCNLSIPDWIYKLRKVSTNIQLLTDLKTACDALLSEDYTTAESIVKPYVDLLGVDTITYWDKALALSEMNISRQVALGSGNSTATFNISKTGEGISNYTITGTNSWLSVSSAQGSISTISTFVPITITLKPAGLAAGTYTATLTVSDTSACNKMQKIKVSFTIATSVAAKTTANNLSILPNPVQGSMRVTHQAALPNAALRIVGTNGLVIATYKVNAGSKESNIDCSGFYRGEYILEFINGGKKTTVKFLK